MTKQLRAEGLAKVTATAVGTNAGVSATLSKVTGSRTIVTHISGSGDAAALVTLESPSGTKLWQKRFAAAFTFSENFHYGEYEAAAGQDILVKVSTSASNSEANIAGVTASNG
jgi:hypothetical protein